MTPVRCCPLQEACADGHEDARDCREGDCCGVDGLELVETGYDLALLAFLAFPSCREVGFLEEIQAIGIM